MKRDSALTLLGLAKAAGKVKVGEKAEKSIKAKKAHLLILAEDVAGAVEKKYTDKCAFYQVPILRYAKKESLGKALGKTYLSAAAVEDLAFSNKIREEVKKKTNPKE